MSATAPLRRPAALRLPAQTVPAQAKPAHPRPRLVLISQRRPTAGRLPFLILVGAVMVVGLVSVLLLHMMAAQDAYRVSALQEKLATLHDQEQELASQVDADSAPSALRHRATALGMRPTTVEKYHQLKDGRAVGLQTPAYVPPAPTTATTKADAKNLKNDTSAKAGKAAKTDTTGKADTAGKSKQQTATSHKPAKTGKSHHPGDETATPTKP
jgi:hypothetical protein